MLGPAIACRSVEHAWRQEGGAGSRGWPELRVDSAPDPPPPWRQGEEGQVCQVLGAHPLLELFQLVFLALARSGVRQVRRAPPLLAAGYCRLLLSILCVEQGPAGPAAWHSQRGVPSSLSPINWQ